MKRLLWIMLASLFFLISCEKKETGSSDTLETAVQEKGNDERISLTCLHPSGYRIRETPNAEIFPFTVIYMEEVTWTGESEKLGNFEWWEVENEDGTKKGWVHELFFAMPDSIAIMTSESIIYDEAKLTAVNIDGKMVPKYQVVSIRENEGNYISIKWTEKDGTWGQGYIKNENYTSGEKAELDMEVLEILAKLNAPNLNETVKEELLKNALQLRSSSFYPEILEFRDEWENRKRETTVEPPMPLQVGSLLKINREGVNMRDQPSLTDSEVIATLSNQTEVLVIEEGNDLIEVEGFGSNFWYKVSAKAPEEGEEDLSGWIFGAFLSE